MDMKIINRKRIKSKWLTMKMLMSPIKARPLPAEAYLEVYGWEFALYRLKAMICVFLNFGVPTWSITNFDWSEHVPLMFGKDKGKGGIPWDCEYSWWDEFWVGHGLFRNWWCGWYRNADC